MVATGWSTWTQHLAESSARKTRGPRGRPSAFRLLEQGQKQTVFTETPGLRCLLCELLVPEP